MYEQNRNSRLFKVNIALIALLMVLCTAATTLAVAADTATETIYAPALDGENVEYQDAEDNEANLAAQATVSQDEAVKLAMANVNGSGNMQVTSAMLYSKNGVAVYSIIMVDVIGDARLRLVDAKTGEVSVGALWDNESAQDNEHDNEQNGERHEARAENGDGQSEDASIDTAPNITEDVQTGENDEDDQPVVTPALTSGQAIDLVMSALKADAKWILEAHGTVETDAVTCYQVSATSPDGYAQSYLVNAETGSITLTQN